MMRYVRISLSVALLLGAGRLPAQADTLGVGDPAPKLDVKSFVKGEPVSEFRARQELRRGILGDLVRTVQDKHPPSDRTSEEKPRRHLYRGQRLGSKTRTRSSRSSTRWATRWPTAWPWILFPKRKRPAKAPWPRPG